jgi:hypothetical protein
MWKAKTDEEKAEWVEKAEAVNSESVAEFLRTIEPSDAEEEKVEPKPKKERKPKKEKADKPKKEKNPEPVLPAPVVEDVDPPAAEDEAIVIASDDEEEKKPVCELNTEELEKLDKKLRKLAKECAKSADAEFVSGTRKFRAAIKDDVVELTELVGSVWTPVNAETKEIYGLLTAKKSKN